MPDSPFNSIDSQGNSIPSFMQGGGGSTTAPESKPLTWPKFDMKELQRFGLMFLGVLIIAILLQTAPKLGAGLLLVTILGLAYNAGKKGVI